MEKTTIMFIVIVILVAIVFFILGTGLSIYYLKNYFVDLFNSTMNHFRESFMDDAKKIEDFYVKYDGLETSYYKNLDVKYNGKYNGKLGRFLIKLCNNCSVSNYFSDKSKTKENIAPPIPEGIDEFVRIISPEGHKVGYMFYDTKNKVAILIWSSIITATQWLSVFNFKPMSLPKDIYDDSNVKFHSGFVTDYLSIREKLIYALQVASIRGCEKIIIAGNSGGGAMSLLSVFDMFENDLIPQVLKDNMHIYTYGSVRCVNTIAAKYFEKFQIKTHLRIINVEDPIPSIQPIFSHEEFDHVGNIMAFEKNLGNLYSNHTKAYLEYLPK